MAKVFRIYETTTNYFIGQTLLRTDEVQDIENAGFTVIPTEEQEVTR